jgi:mono/diheme cytochrome c family protein
MFTVRKDYCYAAAFVAIAVRIGLEGRSTNGNAPKFRDLSRLYTLLALREPITRGIAAPHDQMPQFAVSDEQIDMIVAYINSLPMRR